MEEARGPAEIGFDDLMMKRRVWLAVAGLSPLALFVPGIQIFAVFALPVAIGTLLGARFRTPIAPPPTGTGSVDVDAHGVRFFSDRIDVRVTRGGSSTLGSNRIRSRPRCCERGAGSSARACRRSTVQTRSSMRARRTRAEWCRGFVSRLPRRASRSPPRSLSRAR